MKVEHDGDGKLYYIDSNKQLHWIVEVQAHEGDIVRDAINLLLKQANGLLTGDKQLTKPVVMKSVCTCSEPIRQMTNKGMYCLRCENAIQQTVL